ASPRELRSPVSSMIPRARASFIWASLWSTPISLAPGCSSRTSLAKEPPISPNPMTTTFISKSFYGFHDLFFRDTEGKPDIPLPYAAKNGARGNEQVFFVQQFIDKGLRGQGPIGQLGPEEHPHRIPVVTAAQGVGQSVHQFPTPPIDGIQGLEPFGTAFQGHGGTFLDPVEHPGIHIALDLENRAYMFGAAQDHAHAPARHIKGLAQAIEFQT